MLRSFSAGTFIGPGDRRRSGRGLREGSRHRGVESHVTFDFLEHLVDVTVKHRHRAEALQISQSAFAIACSPAPLRINRPERDVREDDNRRARSEIFHVGLEPFELLVAELSQTAGLKVQDVDQSNEMDSVLVEAVLSPSPWLRRSSNNVHGKAFRRR